mgnify:CR=1 FL=1
MTTTFVEVKAGSERWSVPRGWGRSFRELADVKPSTVRICMAQIGFGVSDAIAASWPALKRAEAVLHARTMMAKASDNPGRVFPRPTWLTAEPFKGPIVGTGVFAQAAPTVLPA